MKIIATVFDTADIEESGSSDYELKEGVRVRRYRLRRGCTERGIEVSAEVANLQEARDLLGRLFELAGIGAKPQKAARD